VAQTGPGSNNWTSGQYTYDYDTNTWWTHHITGGRGGGSAWVKTSPPAGITPPKKQWSPDDANHPPDHPLPKGDGPPPPPVPGATKTGGGSTAVSTPSLDLFATNIDLLIDPVSGLVDTLTNMKGVQPGAFYHADKIRGDVSGDNGDAGIRAKYLTACNDLSNGLTALREAIKTLSKNYKTIEDANKGTAQDVTKALNEAAGNFGGFVTAAGGSGGGSGGGSSG
jgi:hypothetical protein